MTETRPKVVVSDPAHENLIEETKEEELCEQTLEFKFKVEELIRNSLLPDAICEIRVLAEFPEEKEEIDVEWYGFEEKIVDRNEEVKCFYYKGNKFIYVKNLGPEEGYDMETYLFSSHDNVYEDERAALMVMYVDVENLLLVVQSGRKNMVLLTNLAKRITRECLSG